MSLFGPDGPISIRTPNDNFGRPERDEAKASYGRLESRFARWPRRAAGSLLLFRELTRGKTHDAMTTVAKTQAKPSKRNSNEEPYEPEAFAKKYGIPPGEAKTIIKRYGPSRQKLDTYMAARNA